jgi:hypothetical protein
MMVANWLDLGDALFTTLDYDREEEEKERKKEKKKERKK